MTPTTTETRLHGLDALRGGALMLGVVLHGAMSFFPTQIWIVADDQRSTGAAVIFFAIHLFRMATFFLIAGLFAHLLLNRRGAWGFIRDRLSRIAAPLVAFWPLVMASIIAVLIWIGARAGMTAADTPPPPSYDWTNIPLTHLWFLWVLLIFYVGFLALAGLGALLSRFQIVGRLADALAGAMTGPAGPLLLAAPLALALWSHPGWIPFFAIPTPDAGLIPNTPALVGFGLAFGLGVMLDRRRDLLTRIGRLWPWFLALGSAAGVTVLALWSGFEPVNEPAEKAAAAAVVGVAIYALSLAAVGLSLRLFSGASAIRRYVSDAAYWTYIVHLPLVMAAQVWIQHLAWPWPLKLALVVGGVLALSFASYEILIRHTFMGRWLNGRRVHWRRPAQTVAAPAE